MYIIYHLRWFSTVHILPIPCAFLPLWPTGAKHIPPELSGVVYSSHLTGGDLLSPPSPTSPTESALSAADPDGRSETGSLSSSLKRPHRPPDLDLTSLTLTPIHHHDITIHTSTARPSTAAADPRGQGGPSLSEGDRLKHGESVAGVQVDFDPTRSSTPTTATKLSGSVSERVSLVPVSQKFCEYPQNVRLSLYTVRTLNGIVCHIDGSIEIYVL